MGKPWGDEHRYSVRFTTRRPDDPYMVMSRHYSLERAVYRFERWAALHARTARALNPFTGKRNEARTVVLFDELAGVELARAMAWVPEAEAPESDLL